MGACGPTCVVFDESLTDYDFGHAHPMNPIRVDLTMRLARDLGVVDGEPGGLVAVPAPDASDEDLLVVHDPDLIEAVRRSSEDPERHDSVRGLGTDDNPTFAHMHEAARHIVGASLEAARQVWHREVVHAANIA